MIPLKSLLKFPTIIFLFIFLFQSYLALAAEPFAIVELFTSEGCSSCPPADEVLQELTKIASRQKKQIYTLGFHVDYWNYLGWRDPFSQGAFTERQRDYARVFRTDTIFTPQMIINGEVGFSGYDFSRAQKEIEKSLSKTPSEKAIEISIKEISADSISLTYATINATKNTILNIALIQKKAHSDVKRGENAGKNLEHVHVVTVFKTLNITNPSGNCSISTPSNFELDNFLLFAYLQDSKTMAITAAKSILLRN